MELPATWALYGNARDSFLAFANLTAEISAETIRRGAVQMILLELDLAGRLVRHAGSRVSLRGERMEADEARFEVGALLAETFALIICNRWRVAIAIAILCTIGVLTDLKGSGSSGNMLFTFIAIGFQVWMTEAILTEMSTKDRGARSSGIGIRVSFVSQLGILLGLVLLIIPGLIAFVRWSMVLPIALSQRVGVIESMRRSWHRTEGHFWPILSLLMLVYVPAFGVATAVVVIAETTMPVLVDVIMNVLIRIALITGWHAALALFLAGEPRTAALEEVFA